MNEMQTAGIGDNRPPPAEAELDALKARTDALVENANRWANERPQIASEDEAIKARDFLEQLRQQFKSIETERKAAKQPHLDAGAAVDARYNPLKRPIEISADLIKKLLQPWLAKKDAEVKAERARRDQEARLAAEEAERARRAAEETTEGDVVGATVRAEEAADAAKDAERRAKAAPDRARVASAYGGRAASLRKHIVIEIEDIDKIPARYLRKLCKRPYVQEALIRALREDLTAARIQPGVTVKDEQRVT